MAVRSQEMRSAPMRAAAPRQQPTQLAPRANTQPAKVRPVTLQPSISLHSFAYIATLLLALVAIYAVMGNVFGLVQTKIDDIRYGTPRTFQLDAVVGHENGSGLPTHLIAMNLNRQVVIMEIPGGNAAQIRTLTGPYLFGANEDKTAVLMRLEDLNGDSAPDLIVSIKNEEIAYMNRDGQFQLITAEERQQITTP